MLKTKTSITPAYDYNINKPKLSALGRGGATV